MEIYSLIRRAGGLLTGSRRFRRWSYESFLWIYRRRGWRYLYQSSVSLVLTLGATKVIDLHEVPETPLWQWLIPAITLLFALLGWTVTALPLSIVAYGWKAGQVRDRHMASQLNSALKSCEQTATAAFAEEVIPDLLKKLQDYEGTLTILSPNALYLQADGWSKSIEECLNREEARHRLKVIAEYAQAFREQLVRHKGAVHWILPDPRDPRVRELLTDRAHSLTFEATGILEANKKALRWLMGELTRSRSRKGLKTYVHLCAFVPDFRLLLMEEGCVFQRFPRDGYGFMMPIYRFPETDVGVYSAAKIALTSWCGIT